MSALPTTTFSVYRSWILGRYTTTYQTALRCDLVSLSRVINGFLQLIVPLVYDPAQHRHLPNFKGRDGGESILSELPRPHQDEVLRIGGEIATAEVHDTFQWEPFDISCTSHFKGFDAGGGILYTGETAYPSDVPAWLPLRLIGAAAPIKPAFFRFAAEHFRPVRTFASLMAAPQVTESFLLDCTETSCALRLTIDSRKPVSDELIESTSYLTPSSRVLASIFGFDFIEDVKVRLRR